MLAHCEYNNISIENYCQEILQTDMLALCVYVTRLFTIVYLEVISNVK